MKPAFVRPLLTILLSTGVLAAADPQLVGLLMPGVKVVAGVNVEQAKNSPFGQFLLSNISKGDQGLSKLTAATGFDPTRDLSEVLMGTIGQPGDKGLVLARGVFNTPQIFSAAQAGGHTVETYKGIQMLTGADGSLTHALAILDSSIAVTGDIDSVKAAIDRQGNPSKIDASLAAKIGQLSQAEDAWSVSIVPFSQLTNGKLPDAKLNGMLNSDVLKNITETSGGVKLGAMIQISAEAVARSDKDATALADVIRFLGSMVQANAPAASAAAVTSLVQSLNVTADGSTVKLALAIPEDQIESMLFVGRDSAPHRKR